LAAQCLDSIEAGSSASRLQSIVKRLATTNSEHLRRLTAAGATGNTVWAAYAPPIGFPTIEWLSCQGRLPPVAVLEIARQMTIALGCVEAAGFVHGSICAASLWLHQSGRIQLADAGFRAALSTNHSVSDDIYACGQLWWHLLTGRPPIIGAG